MSGRFDSKTRRKVEREERKKHDPWFGKKRVTDFPNRKKVADKKACRDKRGWQ